MWSSLSNIQYFTTKDNLPIFLYKKNINETLFFPRFPGYFTDNKATLDIKDGEEEFSKRNPAYFNTSVLFPIRDIGNWRGLNANAASKTDLFRPSLFEIGQVLSQINTIQNNF